MLLNMFEFFKFLEWSIYIEYHLKNEKNTNHHSDHGYSFKLAGYSAVKPKQQVKIHLAHLSLQEANYAMNKHYLKQD